jgi:hypothetical protein
MHMLGFAIAQHLDNGDLTLLGWTTAAVYMVGALLCARAGMVTGQAAGHRADKREPWRVLTTLLLFLGINKKLNLQTLLIGLGRAGAWSGGWYQHRREVQAVFVLLFTLVLLAALMASLRRWRWFLKEHPLVLAGVLLLFLFIAVRASNFNHVEQLLHLNLYDDYWGWILEWGGTACLGLSAAQVKAR